MGLVLEAFNGASECGSNIRKVISNVLLAVVSADWQIPENAKWLLLLLLLLQLSNCGSFNIQVKY